MASFQLISPIMEDIRVTFIQIYYWKRKKDVICNLSSENAWPNSSSKECTVSSFFAEPFKVLSHVRKLSGEVAPAVSTRRKDFILLCSVSSH